LAKPYASVLIDTYNHERFIEQAVRSVLEQDFPASDREVLVVDDGSTDRTCEIVRRFEPHVRYLRKQNGGQASAFNAGIQECQGEIVAFLDGDDWWAPRKLSAVAGAFADEVEVGVVGHGLTEVYPDGRQRVEALREISRFRITSPEEAKKFSTRRSFLGSSRVTYRRETLCRIGPVPEPLAFEADEYLSALAGLFADVLILAEPLTFYRLHNNNLFQITGGNTQATRKKQQVLSFLAQLLDKKFKEEGIPLKLAKPILECVEVEADVLRLRLDGGFPWETVSTELKIMRVFHSDASLWQHLFTYARLVPAAVMPASTYYRWRNHLSRLPLYQEFRRKFMPFPVPRHIERNDKLAS